MLDKYKTRPPESWAECREMWQGLTFWEKYNVFCFTYVLFVGIFGIALILGMLIFGGAN